MRINGGVGVAGTVAAVAWVTLVAGALGGCQKVDGEWAPVRDRPETSSPTTLDDIQRNAVLDELAAVDVETGAPSFEDCEAVATAMMFALSHEADRPYLVDESVQAEWEAEAERLRSAVPPELLDEIDVVRASGRALVEAMGPLGPEDLVDPALEQRGNDAEKAFDTPELREATDTLGDYLLRCPAL